uniref:Uncharacterized protein n=1 Tax=viral metagenome TaxID=1070528 RepID=A0A6M3JCV0_9ZZZZ
MDYIDIRKKFAELSGRWDLLTTNFEDDGADFFLNAGQRYLDRLLSDGKMFATYPVIVAAGTFIVKSIGIRAIKEVWAGNVDGKYQLIPDTLNKLKTEYSEEFSDVPQGAPKYYAPALLRPYPDTLASTTGMYNVSDLLTYSATAPAQHFNYDGIVIMPPPDETYTIEIVGLFYSPTLSATLSGAVWTQTKSFWTEVHPEILLEAAIYKLHGLYHNTSGAADYKALALEDAKGIDHDAVEEQLTGDLVMGG